MGLAASYLRNVEDIIEAFPYYPYHLGAAVDRHRALESHGTDIIQPVEMVGMGMGYKDCIGCRELFPQHLDPELRGHVYYYICPLGLDIDRTPGTVVLWIG